MAKHLSLFHQRGFTLVELTVSIVLLSIVFVTGAHMVSDSLSSAQWSNRAHVNAAAARYAIERLSREIRGVRYDQGTSRYFISTALPTHMVFVKNGPSAAVNVDIQLNGQTLTLGYPGSTSQYVLIDHVSGFTFGYEDQNRVATQDMSLVRFVSIAMTLSDPQSPVITLQTLIALRGA